MRSSGAASGATLSGSPLMRLGLSYRAIFLVVAFAMFATVLIFGAAALSSTRGNDASTVAQMAQTIAAARIEGGYAVMAWLHASTSPALRVVVQVVLGAAFILMCLWPLRYPRWLAIMTFLLIAPILFFLTLFIKDTALVVFVIGSALVLRSKLPEMAKVALVCAIYCVFALLFRQYYYLIVVVFLGLCLLRHLPPVLQVAAVVIGFVALAFVPSDVFYQLQHARDAVNAFRVGRDVEGARTAFVNIVEPGGYGNFLINYGYAIARLHLPFLFGPFRVQEAYLLLNLAAYAGLVWVSLRSRSRFVQTPGLLFVSHFAVLMLFEPDLGSYLRHLSSALPYLVPAAVLLDLPARRVASWRPADSRPAGAENLASGG